MSNNKSEPTARPGIDDAAKPSAPEPKSATKSTGRVKFDDRGSAIWEWSIATGAFGREVSEERLQKLEHPALSLADDSSALPDAVRANPLGTKKGYDPYDSGELGKAAAPRKKDLRRLGEFLKSQKQGTGNKDDDK